MIRYTLAAAGMADAFASVELFVMWCGLIVIMATVIAGWMLRFRVAAATAISLLAAFTLLFAPWSAFRTVGSQDPDEVEFAASFRLAAEAWIVVSVLVVVSLPMIIRRRGKADDQQPISNETEGS